MTTMTDQYDPWASAEAANEDTARQGGFNGPFWGLVMMDIWACALVKGEGKVKFDPQVHKRPTAAINLVIVPLPEMDWQYNVERDLVEFEPGWYKFMKPSIHAAGIGSVRDVPGMYCRAHFEETGETYTNSKGETKTKTVPVFEKFFKTQDECAADWLAYQAGAENIPGYDPQANPPNAQTPNNGNGSDANRATAEQFLEAFCLAAWQQTGELEKAKGTLAPMIASNPLLAQYFTVDSPEVAVALSKVAMK